MSDEDEPGWFTRARLLLGAGSATVAGVSIWEAPGAWVLATVATWIVDGILNIGREIGALVILVNRQIAGAFADAGGVTLDAVAVVASPIFVILDVVDETLVTLSTAAGPLSFVVTIGALVAVALSAALAVRGVIEVIRFI